MMSNDDQIMIYIPYRAALNAIMHLFSGLMQKKRNSIANALELGFLCIKLSCWSIHNETDIIEVPHHDVELQWYRSHYG